jgi:hypothetical protein
MHMQTPSLSELQTWFLTVVTAAGGTRHGLELARQRFGWSAQHIVAQPTEDAALRRMHIYADGYIQRLLECLQTDYPVLQKVMGEPLFDFFAKAYIWQHPSVSTTLYDLGAGFADFLRASQRAATPDMAGLLLLPIELARLERARTEANRARGLEQAPTHGGSSPFDLMMGHPLCLRAPACLRLLQLELPLLEFWEGISQGGEVAAAPAPARSHVAITRMHYRVNALYLEAWQYYFLQALDVGTGPDSAALASQRAMAVAAAQTGLPTEQVLTQLMVWLPVAESLGLLQ